MKPLQNCILAYTTGYLVAWYQMKPSCSKVINLANYWQSLSVYIYIDPTISCLEPLVSY